MQITITPRDCGGTEFLALPHRLHLGAKDAEGVDRLQFVLPDAWQKCAVTLHIKHSDGSLSVPIPLDGNGEVPVGRSFTGWASGEWMLAATNGDTYAAYTRPGRYDVHGTLPTDGTVEDPAPSVYEQFVAQVVASAHAASQSAQNASASAEQAESYLTQTRTAARQAAANSSLADSHANRAESAAVRAEMFAPSDGTVLSVNGKGGAVQLRAADVEAIPCPVAPISGGILQVLHVDPSTGALTVGTLSAAELRKILDS